MNNKLISKWCIY